MSFDPSVITAGPTCRQLPSGELRVSWDSTVLPGTPFQIYVDRQLRWTGTETTAYLPLGPGRRRIWVGAVDFGEERQDFSSSLIDPYSGGDRAKLRWHGGRHLDATLASFAIEAGLLGFARSGFGSGGFGTAEMIRAGTVAAAPLARWMDGFGRGRFGRGGFGLAEVAYAWTSGPLVSGTWRFDVVPIDDAGNEGTAQTTTMAIVSPPRPPTSFGPGMGRVHYSYSAGTRTLTLNWNPSPA